VASRVVLVEMTDSSSPHIGTRGDVVDPISETVFWPDLISSQIKRCAESAARTSLIEELKLAGEACADVASLSKHWHLDAMGGRNSGGIAENGASDHRRALK